MAENLTARRQLVQVTAEHLRERIFARAPGDQIGSLPELAAELGVGIVTVQQAARILEHEGLLDVRRGPGGGYYGRRPQLADMERLLAGYMRSDPASWPEVLDMTSLLFNRLCAAAARCTDEALHEELWRLGQTIAACPGEAALAGCETQLHELLFRMVKRPLFELLTRVALGFHHGAEAEAAFRTSFAFEQWKHGRVRIIDAILSRDPELAHFEADRQNRRVLIPTIESYQPGA